MRYNNSLFIKDNYYIVLMLYVTKSEQIAITNERVVQPIHFIGQFFIHPNPKRQQEILYCLKKICSNRFITKIHLLNERIYTDNEMSIEANNSKIIQTNISTRLKYSDVFDYVDKEKLVGYIVIANSDIFLDESISNLYSTSLSTEKAMFALLRFEFIPFYNLSKAKLFGPRSDSQDTWIFHSNFNIPTNCRSIFDFNLGKPGCDNKVVYNLQILGYNVYNDPNKIKSYHYHTTQIRNYTDSDKIPQPFSFIFPYISITHLDNLTQIDSVLIKTTNNFTKFNIINDSNQLYKYLNNAVQRKNKFIVPKKDDNIINFLYYINKQRKIDNEVCKQMKTHTGINITNQESFMNYSNNYLDPFNYSTIYLVKENYKNIPIHKHLNYKSKTSLWFNVVELFNLIKHNTLWSHSLVGKNILLISSTSKEQFDKQVFKKELIYGIDLFPECKFNTLQFPIITDQNSNDWFQIYTEHCKEIYEIKNDFDVAFVDCNGFSNPIINYIGKIGKSAIYVGDTLPMYFGIYNEKWEKNRPEILKLYLNEHWIKSD